MRGVVRTIFVAILALGALSGRLLHSEPPIPQPEFAYPVGDPTEPLEPIFESLNVPFPPAQIHLLAFKEEKVLELWAADVDSVFKLIKTYAITAASGKLGPKRKEGDLQVPEGFYRLTDLNPNSRFHLSIRVDYPNATDIANSKVERKDMGGDIFVHGNAVSIGCIAVGDEAIERIYNLAARVPRSGRRILIAPVDFRRRPGFRVEDEEGWVGELYGELDAELARFPLVK